MSSPEILRATLGNMGKEKFSLSQANQSKKLKIKKKNKTANQKREKHSSGYGFSKLRFNLTS